MIIETISERGTTLVRRLMLEPGEATPWHVDQFHRVTVVVCGEVLMIEYRDGGASERISVRAGQCDRDEPSHRAHRALNAGTIAYEEVAIFFLDQPGANPQPVVD